MDLYFSLFSSQMTYLFNSVMCLKQARRQDSVTGGGGGGAEINFSGAREVYFL